MFCLRIKLVSHFQTLLNIKVHVLWFASGKGNCYEVNIPLRSVKTLYLHVVCFCSYCSFRLFYTMSFCCFNFLSLCNDASFKRSTQAKTVCPCQLSYKDQRGMTRNTNTFYIML